MSLTLNSKFDFDFHEKFNLFLSSSRFELEILNNFEWKVLTYSSNR